jgi:hypothetical protein
MDLQDPLSHPILPRLTERLKSVPKPTPTPSVHTTTLSATAANLHSKRNGTNTVSPLVESHSVVPITVAILEPVMPIITGHPVAELAAEASESLGSLLIQTPPTVQSTQQEAKGMAQAHAKSLKKDSEKGEKLERDITVFFLP